MSTWLDTFAPALSGTLAQAGPAAIQGRLQGQDYARQLALLDMQMKAKQQALEQQQQSFPIQLQQQRLGLQQAQQQFPLSIQEQQAKIADVLAQSKEREARAK